MAWISLDTSVSGPLLGLPAHSRERRPRCGCRSCGRRLQRREHHTQSAKASAMTWFRLYMHHAGNLDIPEKAAGWFGGASLASNLDRRVTSLWGPAAVWASGLAVKLGYGFSGCALRFPNLRRWGREGQEGTQPCESDSSRNGVSYVSRANKRADNHNICASAIWACYTQSTEPMLSCVWQTLIF